MRTIAHLSDLHFGTEDPVVCDAVVESVLALAPDLVVVSGDLTQRARRAQFAAARDFLRRLPEPKIVVPGNHDIPLYDVVSRLLTPFERYREHIGPDLSPYFEDDEIAVLGVTTARPLRAKNGRISREQALEIRARLCDRRKFKNLVTHHPFVPPKSDADVDMIRRAGPTLQTFEACRIDLLLSGHLHISYTGNTHTAYRVLNHSTLVAQAGTATSRRTRGEPNTWNVIKTSPERVTVELVRWDGKSFVTAAEEGFRRDAAGLWVREAEVESRA
jgi:3',5'-cyclic AMP phosphodiesterase CpdA